MARYGNLNYPVLAKRGFLLGVALFAVGAIGELFGHAVVGDLPGLVHVVLFDFEIIGVLLGLLSPIVFGIVMPLTE